MKFIIHIQYDVTDIIKLYNDEMSEEEVKEFFADTPEILTEADYQGVVKVERKK